MRLNKWIKKAHIYLGLWNFTILLVFGVAGLNATFHAPSAGPGWTALPPRYEEFHAPAMASDKEVAEAVYQRIRLPLTSPLPGFAIRRDGQQNLRLDFYTPNGPHRVTVLEKENRLRIETMRNSPWQFLNNLHTTSRTEAPAWPLRLWSWYVEASIWSLIAMTLSGVYLWLASRPRHRWGQVSLAVGLGGFALLYWLTR